MTDKSLHVHTPVMASALCSARTKANVVLKLDNLQPSGSFKIRGIGLMCQKVRPQAPFSSSSSFS